MWVEFENHPLNLNGLLASKKGLISLPRLIMKMNGVIFVLHRSEDMYRAVYERYPLGKGPNLPATQMSGGEIRTDHASVSRLQNHPATAVDE